MDSSENSVASLSGAVSAWVGRDRHVRLVPVTDPTELLLAIGEVKIGLFERQLGQVECVFLCRPPGRQPEFRADELWLLCSQILVPCRPGGWQGQPIVGEATSADVAVYLPDVQRLHRVTLHKRSHLAPGQGAVYVDSTGIAESSDWARVAVLAARLRPLGYTWTDGFDGGATQRV